MFLVWDSETTGLPLWNDPSDHPDQPHIVDIAVSLYDRSGVEQERFDAMINPGPGVEFSVEAMEKHGITPEIAAAEGIDPSIALENFMQMIAKCDVVIGHNVSFDNRLMRIMAARVAGEKWDCVKPTFCTMRKTTTLVKAMKPNPRYPTDYKWPTLDEATRHFFGHPHDNAHRARPDTDASARIFFHLKEQGLA